MGWIIGEMMLEEKMGRIDSIINRGGVLKTQSILAPSCYTNNPPDELSGYVIDISGSGIVTGLNISDYAGSDVGSNGSAALTNQIFAYGRLELDNLHINIGNDGLRPYGVDYALSSDLNRNYADSKILDGMEIVNRITTNEPLIFSSKMRLHLHLRGDTGSYYSVAAQRMCYVPQRHVKAGISYILF